MVLHWSLSDSKSLQVSRTPLSILADLNNTVVWIVSTHPVISKSFGAFINPLVTVPRTPITFGINVTFMFQFFQFPSKVEVFILLFTFFQFYSEVSRDSKWECLLPYLFFLLIIIRFGRLADYNYYYYYCCCCCCCCCCCLLLFIIKGFNVLT